MFSLDATHDAVGRFVIAVPRFVPHEIEKQKKTVAAVALFVLFFFLLLLSLFYLRNIKEFQMS